MNFQKTMVLPVSMIKIFKLWLLNYFEFFFTLKFLNGLNPPIMNEVFQIKPSAPYSLRDKNELYSRNAKTVTCGTESVSLLSHLIWSIVL